MRIHKLQTLLTSNRSLCAFAVCVVAFSTLAASATVVPPPASSGLDIYIGQTVNAKLDSILVDPKVGGIDVTYNGTVYGPAYDDRIWAGCYVIDVENIVEDYAGFCMDVTLDPAQSSFVSHTAMSVSSDFEYMWGTYYDDIFDGAGNDSVEAAAFQLAVWEIVHEGSGTYDVSTGDFYLSALNTGSANNNGATMASLIAQANIYLDSGSWTTRATLAALTADGYQPLLVAIPEPATMSLLALSGMAMLRGRRKRS